MPQWRKLHVKATESLDINDMPDDFHRLLWVMLPLGLDREGRGIDNPSWVKAKVMPMRTDVTMGMVAAAMDWYAQRGMIERYVVDGHPCFWVPTFAQYQGNTKREAPSHLPAPNSDYGQDEVTTNSRLTHDQGEQESSIDSDSETDSEIETDSPPTEADAPAQAPSPRKKSKTPKQEASQAMFSALAALCKIEWRVCTEEQRGALNQSEKKLREKVGAIPDDLGEFHRWWYTHDWRGKKEREPPEPHQVREEWGRFTAWREEITPPDLPANGNGPDPLVSWWSLQLAMLNPAWKVATPVSKENGKLVLRIDQPGPRAHLSLPARLQAVEALDGVEEVEIVEC